MLRDEPERRVWALVDKVTVAHDSNGPNDVLDSQLFCASGDSCFKLALLDANAKPRNNILAAKHLVAAFKYGSQDARNHFRKNVRTIWYSSCGELQDELRKAGVFAERPDGDCQRRPTQDAVDKIFGTGVTGTIVMPKRE